MTAHALRNGSTGIDPVVQLRPTTITSMAAPTPSTPTPSTHAPMSQPADSRAQWEGVRDVIGRETFTFGPSFAQQALHAPRHLLFVFSRYKFAARLLPVGRQVDVLELGCGEGVGTLLLAEQGHRVLGVDFDDAAIGYAQEHLVKQDLAFWSTDFLGKSFGQFKAVVSLDVIEHIPVELEDDYFRTVTANLTADGIAVIGTPNETASPYASPQSQAGHVNLYTAERLVAAASRYFENVFVFGMNDEVVHTGFYPMCHYLFVLCVGKRASAVPHTH